MNTKGIFSHKSDEWRTPTNLFNELNAKYHFTLDAAANDNNHLCEKYFTKEKDGIKASWEYETVFCNPPYSNIYMGI